MSLYQVWFFLYALCMFFLFLVRTQNNCSAMDVLCSLSCKGWGCVPSIHCCESLLCSSFCRTRLCVWAWLCLEQPCWQACTSALGEGGSSLCGRDCFVEASALLTMCLAVTVHMYYVWYTLGFNCKLFWRDALIISTALCSQGCLVMGSSDKRGRKEKEVLSVCT